ncbi:MAG: tryptophan-rich sensory protein [Bacteroidetes bacterium]|nr:tryptophan-rich sensory protein [Bacteroidota bacterium]
MKKETSIKIVNLAGFAAALYVNYLSVVTRMGGRSIRELSDKYANLFTPSNQTFAIWSLIYSLVFVFLIAQFFPKYKDTRFGNSYLFLISCILNGGWIVAWQFEMIGLSLLIMLGLLATLAYINRQADAENLLLPKIVFGIYLGWICIATIANVTTWLISLNISIPFSGQVFATLAILIIAAIIVAWVMKKLNNPFLAIAVTWAFYGVYVKRIVDVSSIAYTALAMGALVMLSILIFSIRPVAK